MMSGIPRAVGEMYSIVKKFRSKRSKDLERKSTISEHIMRIMRCPAEAQERMNALSGFLGYTSRQYTQEESIGILSSIAVELFADSNPENRKEDKRVNFGQLSVDLVCHFTSFPFEGDRAHLGPLGLDCIYSLPVLQVAGQIEEKYMDLRKEAMRIDTVGGGD